MDSLRINTGTKKILINDGPDFIEFNPNDIVFAEKFYALMQDFQAKQAEYLERASDLEQSAEVDELGIPTNMGETIALLREVCDFLCERIDGLFGVGTCQKVFGGSVTLDMFEQFFTGITPFIQTSRVEKVEKYSGKVTKKSGRRVMK